MKKENNQEREKVMQFMITSDDDMNNFDNGPIRFLDPDSPAPSILLRPVKKLKKHNIPKSFQDSKPKSSL